MKAFAPWVSIRFIHDPVGDPGLFHCLSSSSLHCFTCRKISASRLPAAQLRVVGKRLTRQLRCHAVCSFSLPSHPNPFPAVMPPAYLAPKHNDVAVMPGATAAGVPPSSSPALAVSFARRGHAAHHLFGLAGPAPFRPQGLPLVSLCPRAVTAPRFATGLSRLWDSGFFLRSLRLPGDLALLGRPEDELTSHRLRGVADDRCAATALPLRLVVPFLCPRPGRLRFAQTALAGVIAAIAVTRTALRPERVTASGCFSCWCSGRQQTRAAQ
jgi:hypothetical protein